MVDPNGIGKSTLLKALCGDVIPVRGEVALNGRLLRGEASEGAVHYASHAVWASREAFEAWTKSENFARAHSGDPLPEGMVLGHPKLQRFKVVLQS